MTYWGTIWDARPHFEKGSRIRLWLDDERPAPPDWYGVTESWQAKFLFEASTQEGFFIEEVSFDHDLGHNGRGDSGYDVATWLEEKVEGWLIQPPEVLECHSDNPVGRARINQALASIRRLAQRPKPIPRTRPQ